MGGPGVSEYELEAALEYVFRTNGAERVGFPSIVGSGPNSTILHYDKSRRTLEDGDLIVFKAGREKKILFETNMENAGVGPKFVIYLTGRTQEGMDKFYFKPTEQDLRVQMVKYEAWLGVEAAKVNKSVKISPNAGLLADSST